MSDYFGTPAEVEKARADRRKVVQAWGHEVLAEADRALNGGVYVEDWYFDDDEPEVIEVYEPDAEPEVLEEEPEVKELDAKEVEEATSDEVPSETIEEVKEVEAEEVKPKVEKKAATSKASTSKGAATPK
jgi:hypothetical protein